jgi:hypothetical protein
MVRPKEWPWEQKDEKKVSREHTCNPPTQEREASPGKSTQDPFFFLNPNFDFFQNILSPLEVEIKFLASKHLKHLKKHDRLQSSVQSTLLVILTFDLFAPCIWHHQPNDGLLYTVNKAQPFLQTSHFISSPQVSALVTTQRIRTLCDRGHHQDCHSLSQALYLQMKKNKMKITDNFRSAFH